MASERELKALLTEARAEKRGSPKAREALVRASSLGSAEATYALATWHLFGVGQKKDVSKGIDLLLEAATGGWPAAFFDLAVSIETKQFKGYSLADAFACYAAAAALGDGDAVSELGRCFWYGIGVTRNRGFGETLLAAARTARKRRKGGATRRVGSAGHSSRNGRRR
jgi:uncharacterized protein